MVMIRCHRVCNYNTNGLCGRTDRVQISQSGYCVSGEPYRAPETRWEPEISPEEAAKGAVIETYDPKKHGKANFVIEGR